ncbi:MAG: hypothetical protein HOP19_21000 [Acidobacteria bacterium]|nr:hypothetical protein [Acidobacteriota bacterium]
MIEFTYRQIGENLINAIIQKIDCGESVVLLGPRFGGKRATIIQLCDRLKEEDRSNVILLRFSGKSQVSNAAELNNVMLREIEQAMPEGDIAATASNPSLFTPTEAFPLLDDLYLRTDKPIILLVSNVDSIPQHLARHFLENIQSRVEKKKLVVVLSGEYDFRDLVNGPNSPFRCANQIVLQGYDESAFQLFFERFATTLQLDFDYREEAIHKLWQWSGGNIYLLRHFFSSVVEHRARKRITKEEKVKVDDYYELPDNNAVVGAYWTQSFRHANQLIAREPDCWGTLRYLIRDGEYKLPAANALPSTLELAGVAIREGSILKFASPWIKTLVKHHFNELHWADLAARQRRWDEAFALYEKIPAENRLRPTDIDDRMEVEAALRALSSSFYSTASRGTDDGKAPAEIVEEVNDLFSKGCRLVLGFAEISFWRSERGKVFQPIGGSPTPVLEQLVNDTVSPSAPPPTGFLPLPQPISSYAMAAMLESIRSDHLDLVVIGDFDKKTVISPEREYLAKELIQHFVSAHDHAVRVSRDRKRLERRNQYFKIANDILNELGRNILDVRQIMAVASRRLHEMGFGRVMFSLIDRSEQRIKGVFDDSETDISQRSSWPLIREGIKPERDQWDIQQLVTYYKQYRIVENARTDLFTDKATVAYVKMCAIAVIPILDRHDEPIGTIHVERHDRTEVLSPGEARELTDFGRQLAIAIEKSERVTLLESTLDETPEPIMIVNPEAKLQYLNLPAARLFGIKPGWRDYKNAESIDTLQDEKVISFVQQALKGNRNSYLSEMITHKIYKGSWLADCIPDWRKGHPLWKEKKAGAWAHIQDLNFFFKVLAAFQKIAAAQDLESAEEASLEATKLLGHKWGRLWLIDEKVPDTLVGKLCYNINDAEAEKQFNIEMRQLPAKGKDKHSWLCLKKKEPVVFCFNPELPDGSEKKNRWGLPYRTVKHPHLTDKLPGDFWLDLPLLAHDEPLGKIALQCDENLRQETFEMLKVLSSITADQLDATRKRDSLNNQLKDSIRVEAAERNMADMAHNIATRFSSLGFLLTRYRLYEEKFSELKEVNDRFSVLMKNVETTVLRAKEMLSVINPVLAPVELVSLIKTTLDVALPSEVTQLRANSTSIIIDADAHYIEMALLEIIHNSQIFASVEKPLQVVVTINGQSQSEKVEIVYEDNGPGIPFGSNEKIFERFYSYRPGRQEGLGLGLNYAQRVIKAHRGSIKEKGVPGEGVKFVIELPFSPTQKQ